MTLRLTLNRRGAVAAIIAMLAVVLIGCVGLAIDMTRAFMVSSRLKTAVDAAALYAAREIDNASGTAYRDARATELFWVNYRANRATSAASYIGSTVTNFSITPVTGDTTKLQVNGTATVDTTLFSVIGRRTMTVNVVSVAQRQGSGLELALVIDQTSSMGASSNVAASGGGYLTKLQAAQQAAGTLLDILYAGADTQQNMWVSVVPFSRSINIGTANSSLLNTTSMATGWSLANWSGCVEARYTSSNDLNDSAPTTAATRFRPYFWPSTYRLVGRTSVGNCTTTNAYAAQSGDGTERYCFGDNDWSAPTTTLLNTNPSVSYLRGLGMAQADVSGPNFLCALTPLLPLTASRTTVQARINAIVAPTKSGGTAIPTGLAGAWYTLSPNWQNIWPNTNAAGGPTLPLAYNTINMRKAIVILTDGDNNWQPQDSYASNRIRANSTTTSGDQLLYSAYGRDSTWQANGFSPAISTAGSQTQGDAALDARLATLCTNIKAQGVLIFVIGFEVSTTAQRTMLQTCASATSSPYYLEAPTSAELQAAFATIARTLSSLRLAE